MCITLMTRQCTYNVPQKRVRATIAAVEKQKYYIFWVCVCSLGYPARKAHAPHYIFICGIPCCIIFFSTLPRTPQYSEKKVNEHEMSILIFPTTTVWNIPNSKKYPAKISSEMYICLHVQYPLFLSDFNETWIFSTDLQKILKYQMSQKSIQWELSCSMQPYRHGKAHTYFLQFCKCT